MANKKYNDYDPGTYDTSKIFLQADPATGALEKVNLPSVVPYSNDIIAAYNALGSTIKAQLVGYHLNNCSNSQPLSSGQGRFSAVYLPQAATLTGVAIYLSTTGNFTGNNFNGFGLYTYLGGTLTLVAQTSNNENHFKGTANSIIKIAFTSPYVAAIGLYFVCILHSRSAVVTAPALPQPPANFNSSMQSVDFTNSAKLTGFVNSLTALPATQAMSGITIAQLPYWTGLY